ncbi:hypothetical protein GCM10009678_23460 [Actinomadura kijaniata]|uniref:Uncharacterized protein n=1 Tax=Actinomadura namibiensis TaxID=182080 RepID=A0A7W3LMW3_ACTNM|nr:hypothetical protein [Actinomadura namibiensis]MBA8951065.1 hypothetical protein [Actinomadura namibiensis]
MSVHRELSRAIEIVKAAYEEAMRTHGLLPSAIELISSYAEANLAALNGLPDGAADDVP